MTSHSRSVPSASPRTSRRGRRVGRAIRLPKVRDVTSVGSERRGGTGGGHEGLPDVKKPAPSVLRWWPMVVPVVIVLVGAWVYRWVDEDAFINFRIIDNLLGRAWRSSSTSVSTSRWTRIHCGCLP